MSRTRRQFLHTAAGAGTLFGLGRAAEVTPGLVRFSPDLEPVVRLIEETPQDRCVAVMVEQLGKGLPYRHFVAALYLAAIRAARWHGSGMHAYDHNAYVVHSAHQLALDLPASEQFFPAFFALNSFKGMQKAFPDRKGTPELTGKLPAADKAGGELQAALEGWDADRAERAVVALARSRGRPEVLEPLWHHGARDWAFIGHQVILVASACRLLGAIGWQHAEHILRYVVQGLAGGGKERQEHAEVRPYRANRERVKKAAERLPGDWAEAAGNAAVTKVLLALLREGKADEACDAAVRHLVEGEAKAGAVWDAVHLMAGELVLAVKPRGAWSDGNALHACTAANALRFAFRASARPDTRLLLMLQGLAWMDLYRRSRKKDITATDITSLSAVEVPERPAAAIDAILSTRTEKPHEAGRLAFGFAQRHRDEPLLRAARRLVAVKAVGDPHELKFPVAIFEDLDHVTPTWRPHLLAAGVFSVWGSGRPDNPAMVKVREALRKL